MPRGRESEKKVTKWFRTIVREIGLDGLRLHSLRHTYATLLLARGIPAKLVQERPGHASITMTLDLYSHVTPEMAKLAADSLNGLLAKRKGPAKAQGE
ncbi:MAG: tyrosine-type recombinase/integrase [Dethiobacter sp.]|nr:tyrosine-type recombinase/integrase [Dethiobacter sp.]